MLSFFLGDPAGPMWFMKSYVGSSAGEKWLYTVSLRGRPKSPQVKTGFLGELEKTVSLLLQKSLGAFEPMIS